MANTTSVYVSNQSNHNQFVGGDVLFTTKNDLHSLYKPLSVVRMSVMSILSLVMISGNCLALCAVRITPRLRVKAYALTTSMTVANLLLSIGVLDIAIRDMFGVLPCELTTYKAIIRPVRSWVIYVDYVHLSVIAVDRYIAVKHALQYENRVTPTVIRNLIVTIWLLAGVFSLPAYLGFIWPDPATCIATEWFNLDIGVQTILYTVGSTTVVVVYARIWKTVMYSELQQQQQQPSLAAAATSITISRIGRGNVEQHGICMLWNHRRLIRKHRTTRTVMAILASFVCLFFPFTLSRIFGVAGLEFAKPMQMVGSWIGFLEFAVNGFIYAVVNHDFRDAYRRILFCRFGTQGYGNSIAPA